MSDDDALELRDITIRPYDGDEGVLVIGHGEHRAVTYEELVELAVSEGPVTIR